MNSPDPKDDQVGLPKLASKTDESGRTIAVLDNHIDSRDLFVATREIIIGHGENHYRLRLTAQNKLILTK
jgi:hemin uptake protein HemP